ncbi:MAG: hypothetical protein A2787_00970 [Omnitrophica WOR_2 bacterium RIFCSPHIGHO2_01_FULL_48_9]|nr:MAG: hypothetical protein A3D10_05800 [Omnitrophica WOR_2 bacterium RIFCSPHIGHO2_02_FULL_48_11]OGX31714.1 MAG: hypothetical protein A2787_00970 [Omnitrophica WOR_2 bacterium RIFCSPHIGHO2_01_FULL_48_9]
MLLSRKFLRKIKEFQICFQPTPGYLYKYFPLREANKQDWLNIKTVLEESKLHFSRLKDFNDPFDCFPIYITPDKDLPSWIKRLRREGRYPAKEIDEAERSWRKKDEKCSKIRESFGDGVQKNINEEIGICCFSKKPDDLLMWAHYASYHKGVCFEFEAVLNTPFFGEAQGISYKSNRPTVNIFTIDSHNATDHIFLTKSDHWKYESEYRIMDPNKPPGFHQFPIEHLKGIILGSRIDSNYEIQIRKILEKNSRVKLKRAELDQKQYKINIITI